MIETREQCEKRSNRMLNICTMNAYLSSFSEGEEKEPISIYISTLIQYVHSNLIKYT